jgi:hypothetical protein
MSIGSIRRNALTILLVSLCTKAQESHRNPVRNVSGRATVAQTLAVAVFRRGGRADVAGPAVAI